MNFLSELFVCCGLTYVYLVIVVPLWCFWSICRLLIVFPLNFFSSFTYCFPLKNSLIFFSQLSEGSLEDNCIVDGSRITLLPRAETGLLVSHFHMYYSLYFSLQNIFSVLLYICVAISRTI